MRCCATARTSTSPASLRTRRCLETCGCRRPSCATISPTARGLRRSSSTIWSRFGSARALNVACMSYIYLYRHMPVKAYLCDVVGDDDEPEHARWNERTRRRRWSVILTSEHAFHIVHGSCERLFDF